MDDLVDSKICGYVCRGVVCLLRIYLHRNACDMRSAEFDLFEEIHVRVRVSTGSVSFGC